MFKDLLEIIEKYKKIIIPALESGQLEMNDTILNSFLQFVHTIYSNTNYNSSTNEFELKNKLSYYYIHKNNAAISGMMYSFMLSAGAILSLQYGFQNISYNVQTRMAHIANEQRNFFWEKNHLLPSKKPFEGKGVIYSAITGNYDNIHDPAVKDSRFDYILFTNNHNIKSDFWEIVHLDNTDNLDNVRLARNVKIQGYKYLEDYDYSIWVDGKLQIVGDINKYIELNKNRMPILCMPHYINNCVYEELEACERLQKDNIETMRQQIERYKQENYPSQYGMIDSCVLVRDLKDSTLNSIMDTWWNEVLNNSYRDQLSFNYSFWKNDYIYDTANIYCYDNPYF